MVGTALLIKDQRGRYLVGKRKGSHEPETWAFFGGHVDNCTIETGALNELFEELGVYAAGCTIKDFIEHQTPEGYRYVTFFIEVILDHGVRNKIKIMEPDKCSELAWHFLDEIPKPHFSCLAKYLSKVLDRDDE